MTDPLHPPPPEPAFFDTTRNAWILSRYSDVLAAFRERRLWPVGTRKRDRSQLGDEQAQAKLRGDLQVSLAPTNLAEWESQFAPRAHELLAALPPNQPVDLVSGFAMPWSLQVAITVTGADPSRAADLVPLARAVSAASAEPYDHALQSAKAIADPELERYFADSTVPMAAPAFVALSHTLPSLLADMWVALLRHPAEMQRLKTDTDLMPKAIEELLRYAGLARMLFRQAMEEVRIGDVTILEGGTAELRVASANRDPDQFDDPNRLDLTRRPAGQLALGAGGHSCAGAFLIRMAASVAVRAFVDYFATAELREPVEWSGGSSFRSPKELWV